MSDVQKKKMLMNACLLNRVGEVEKLLKEAPSLLNVSLDEDGWTPLHCASINGETEVVRLLLASNADINKQSKAGETPLHFASSNDNTEVVKALLASNADINKQSEAGETPLHYASCKGRIEIVNVLLASNGDPNIQKKDGKKPGEYFSPDVKAATKQEIRQLLENERKKRKEAQQQKSTTLSSSKNQSSSSSSLPTTNSSPSTPTSSTTQTPSTGASSATSSSLNSSRTDDVAKEDLNNNLPIKGVWDKPLLSFEEAVQIANVPTLDIDDVYSCLEYFEDVETPPPGLTINEACAVRFYTMETPFYGAFNSALRTRDRNEAKCFFPFLQLLLLAMHKLPKSKGTLFRGTRNLPVHVIEEYKKKSETKKCVFWGACSSTTTSVKTLSNPMFCGKEGNRVKFVIQDCDLGVSIQALSAIGVEKEVLLPPCLRFVVEDYVDLGNGLLEFQLRYSAPRREVIPLVPPPQFLSSSAP